MNSHSIVLNSSFTKFPNSHTKQDTVKRLNDALSNNHVTSVEQYKKNEAQYKEQAYNRAMSSQIYQVTKNADGTIEASAMENSNDFYNWAALDINLRGHTSGVAVTHDIDFMASEYVQAKTQVEQRFTGEKRDEQLAKLDELFNTHLERYADNFTGEASKWFKNNGSQIDERAMKESITDAFHQRTVSYEQLVNTNEQFQQLTGTKDEWMLYDTSYFGTALRYEMLDEPADFNIANNNEFSTDELTAIGILMKETRGMDSLYFGSNMSEEQFGMELGIAAMKFAAIKEQFQLSDSFKANLDETFSTFIDQQNKRMANYIKSIQQDPFSRDKEAHATDWNEAQVKDIVNEMTERMAQGAESLQSFFQEVMETYAEKASTSKLSRYNALHNEWAQQNYAGQWNQFIQSPLFGNELSSLLLSENQRFNVQL